MCGRYANHVHEMADWVEILGDWPGDAMLSMDIAPSQNVPVVVNEPDGPRAKNMRWGLVPAWSKTPKPKYATFNARIESVQQKPAFRGAFARSQACLVPASGYYEWTGEKGHKIRHYIQMQDASPLVMAGLWEYWEQGSEHLYSCTILTRPALPSIAGLHPRMPLILGTDQARNWLQQPLAGQLEELKRYDDYRLVETVPQLL